MEFRDGKGLFMSESMERDFSELTLVERIASVDVRTGNQPDRIKHPYELLKLRDKTIYIVLSPFGKDDDIGTCFMFEWVVGEVTDHRGSPVTEDTELTFDNGEKYICFNGDKPENGLSLKDINIVPNSYNNHAVFITEEAAEAYAMYRKMMFAEDSSIAELEGDYAPFFTADDVARLLKAEKSEDSSK